MSLLKVAGTTATSGQLYVNDVFSVYLYTGNGSTQTITNGIDLAGEGGLVWVKSRSIAGNAHFLTDTERGVNKVIYSNLTLAQITKTAALTNFNSDGFTIGSEPGMNASSDFLASWTFRKAAKFFDVVTYTGNGTTQNIAHNLGSVPGCIMVKEVSAGGNDWQVYHRSTTNVCGRLFLNLTNAENATNRQNTWGDNTNPVPPTSTVFTVGNTGGVNNSGNTYVAYLFAHDTSSTGIIQCGSFTADASGIADVSLGWEPQYLLYKDIGAGGYDWQIVDSMRGFTVSTADKLLQPNTSAAESSNNVVGPTATGFHFDLRSGTYIYMAIRMPNKPPTSGTQVFQRLTRSGGFPGVETAGVGPWDTFIDKFFSSTGNWFFGDRLRGKSLYLSSNSTNAETTDANSFVGYDVQNGYTLGSTLAADSIIQYFLKRAPGFFDVVCYTTSTLVNHNLGVAPELVIYKTRSVSENWYVCTATNGIGYLNLTNAWTGSGGSGLGSNYANVSATQIAGDFSVAGVSCVAYLFATLAGISKVGSYTGNGTGQVIACGFSAGARFVLIKRTDSTGDWYTFDSARGLTSGSSPYLLLNSAAAETTGDNGVYASTGGFTLGATAITTTNIATATYIFLAVA